MSSALVVVFVVVVVLVAAVRSAQRMMTERRAVEGHHRALDTLSEITHHQAEASALPEVDSERARTHVRLLPPGADVPVSQPRLPREHVASTRVRRSRRSSRHGALASNRTSGPIARIELPPELRRPAGDNGEHPDVQIIIDDLHPSEPVSFHSSPAPEALPGPAGPLGAPGPEGVEPPGPPATGAVTAPDTSHNGAASPDGRAALPDGRGALPDGRAVADGAGVEQQAADNVATGDLPPDFAELPPPQPLDLSLAAASVVSFTELPGDEPAPHRVADDERPVEEQPAGPDDRPRVVIDALAPGGDDPLFDPPPVPLPPLDRGSLRHLRPTSHRRRAPVRTRTVAAAAIIVVGGAAGAAAAMSGGHSPSKRPAAVAAPTTTTSVVPTTAAPTTTTPPARVVLISSDSQGATYGLRGTAEVQLVGVGRCWVEVRQGGPTGAVAFEGILLAGDRKTYPGPVWVRLGLPSAVTVLVNGTPIQPSPETSSGGAPYNLDFESATTQG